MNEERNKIGLSRMDMKMISDYNIFYSVDSMMEKYKSKTKKYNIDDVKGIWFNKHKGITVVKWNDDTITKVQLQEIDYYEENAFDEEKGIALCFMKKAMGNTGKYNEVFKKFLDE